MQKKNLLRLLALAMMMVMVLAIALPALAETEVVDEPEELDAELLEEVVEEEEAEEVVEEEVTEEIARMAWTKYFSTPVYSAKSLATYKMSFRAFTRVHVAEVDGYWTKIEFGLWYNNLDGLGNQILWVPAYVPTSYLTYEKPEFESLYNVYVAR